jgi:hypothetical protein
MDTKRNPASLGRPRRTILVAAFSLLYIASAQAQGTPEQRAACTPDAVRLCSAEIPDIARVTSCMHANRTRLSPRCRLALDAASPGAPQARPAAAHHRRTIIASRHPMHHDHRPAMRHHRRTYSGEAVASTGRVMSRFQIACRNKGVPTEFCDFSNQFLQSGMASNFAGLANGGDFNADMAAQYMNSQMIDELIQTFTQ